MDAVWEILKTLIIGYPIQPEFIDPSYPEIFQIKGGLFLTILITVTSLITGTVLAAFWVFILLSNPSNRLKRLLNTVLNSLIATIRAIPVMVLVLLCFYLPFPLFNIRIPGVFLAITALSIYSTVYLIPLFISGTSVISDELKQTSLTLGFSSLQTIFLIQLPIMVRVMLPAILNIGITVFKDSSVLMVVGIAELTFTSRQVTVSNPLFYGTTLLSVILVYWGVVTVSSFLVRSLERKFAIPGSLVCERGLI